MPLVRFQDTTLESNNKSAMSSNASHGELMEITTNATKGKSLHPIIILMLLNKNQQRIAIGSVLH